MSIESEEMGATLLAMDATEIREPSTRERFVTFAQA